MFATNTYEEIFTLFGFVGSFHQTNSPNISFRSLHSHVLSLICIMYKYSQQMLSIITCIPLSLMIYTFNILLGTLNIITFTHATLS